MELIGALWNSVVFDPMVNLHLWIYANLKELAIPGAYGLAIILFTLVVRVVTQPFYAQQQKAMKKQQELTKSKAWQEMQKKYGKNREKMAQEQMRLYREAGVNPLGGCLPALIPWPIFIALYQSITWVMGTQPEQLMELSRHLYAFLPSLASSIPVDSDFFGFNLASTPQVLGGLTYIVPVLVGFSTWVQQKMVTMPAMDPQAAQMNQTMMMMMPIMIGWFSFQFPIGLSLYWIVFSLVSIVQQFFQGGISRIFSRIGTEVAPKLASPSKGKKDGNKR